ncbi:dynamin family protein [Sporolactobacillus sp. CQH2019]|uniref:dynamin family protein n=1 Tax=Sporolactobacillus sp. CQH2019 TaxID=3023512 RepID=UPI0023687BA8|nr:dynamin family protein [Sporolactobacillus sp. CQH2019]MDD9149087.1 dynamin family protein [Sporolactobacillus sp. CQH2019]
MAELKTEKPAQWMIKMALLYQVFKEHGDHQNADKLRDWYKKLTIDSNVSLAFCGHFSAGKSSLLNRIMNSRLLPSSPIPTSGNLVRITSGAPSVRIETHAGETVILPEHYPLEKLHDLLRDSDSIKRIDIQVDHGLPQGVEWLDTPGVDSTDERHRRATNEALHLVDAVFYVTDYNHVLSNFNFNFMRTLAQLGKPYYLIVNQIDKHRDQEGTFASFKAQIENALYGWQLHPEKIFYLSLIREDLPENDLNSFLKFLNETMKNGVKTAAGQETILQGLRTLTEQHRHFLDQQFSQFLKQKSIDAPPDEDAPQQLSADITGLQSETARLAEQERSWLPSAEEKLSRAIQSAILMPFDVREAAQFYLASLGRQFKTGLFTNRKKIEKERERRHNFFLERFQKQEQTLEWAVKDTLVRIGRDMDMISATDIGPFSGLSKDDLQRSMTDPLSAGVETNSAYLLHFADKVADLTKQKMRKKAMAVIRDLEPLIRERSREKTAPLKRLIAEKEEKLQMMQAVLSKKRELQSACRQLAAVFSDERPSSDPAEAIQYLAQEIAKNESRHQELTLGDYRQKYRIPAAGAQAEKPENKTGNERENNKHTDQAVKDGISNEQDNQETGFSGTEWYRRLTQAAAMLQPLDGFREAADDLVRSAGRLKQQTFTIALFGAFSAGKSSFANALLGEAILPVSPNPTTAVINEIRKPTAGHPNGSAVVQIKSEQTLLDEINQSLTVFDRQITVPSDLKTLLPIIESGHPSTAEYPHAALLHTLSDAIEHFGKKWGGVYETTLSESRRMVADETIACLIERVTMYYDCPFTRRGNILVDTPGASSIHARHTEVAFHYIKNADAILFLTYFNHAFSRSDQEFLIQLGRVKGTFSLDKMFFIINAIDLARTDREEKDVTAYVKGRLQMFGIHYPRLYGVSSKLALQEQKSEGSKRSHAASGMTVFLDDWKAFADQKLMMQVAQSGLKVIQQSAERIARLLGDMRLEGAAKNERIRELMQMKRTVGQSLREIPIRDRTPEINQHIDEWFFYVKKRLIQRYIDEFSQFFEPAGANKTFLNEGLKNCIEFLSFDLDQECRASFLRIEALLKKEWSGIYEQCERVSAGLIGNAGIAASEPAFSSPVFSEHLKDMGTAPLTAVFKFYKNPKQFFEKGGKSLMRDKLQELLDPHLADIIGIYSEHCKAHYLPQFYEKAAGLTEMFHQQTDQAADSHIKMLQDNYPSMFDSLYRIHKDLTDLITG